MKRTILLVLAAVLILASSAYAADSWTEVKAAEVKTMMEQANTLVIYPLSKIEYNNLHIKGSVNIPMHKLAEKLPEDKDHRLVFYCLGRR